MLIAVGNKSCIQGWIKLPAAVVAAFVPAGVNADATAGATKSWHGISYKFKSVAKSLEKSQKFSFRLMLALDIKMAFAFSALAF